MTPILSIENLKAGYGGMPILRGISLDVGAGEIVAVIGRNGVGKTTLMKSIIGLVPLTAGAIHYDGRDITRTVASSRAKLGIGYVPQGRGIFQMLSVEENLRMGELVGDPADGPNYRAVFDLFPRLQERRSQRAGTLSGGEQQMLAIGRVLVGEPRLLLLDEPSEGIQPSIVHQLGRIVRELPEKRSLSVLVVEQNIDLVGVAADRCEVIEKGEIIAHLEPDDLSDAEIAKRYLAL